MIGTAASSGAAATALVTGGAGAFVPAASLALDTADVAAVLQLVFELALSAWRGLWDWIEDGYAKSLAMVSGLAAVLVVPALALAGALVRTVLRRTAVKPPARDAAAPWPHIAKLRIDGEDRARPIAREMVRIGRQTDNDLCLPSGTVHGYHAVIHRTPESDFVITDLSGPDGNGVLVNGERIAQMQLLDGDAIVVGDVRLRFEAEPL